MKIYISGPITGHPISRAMEWFNTAEYFLKEQGYEVFNPLSIASDSELTWIEYMVYDIGKLFECDGIYMLKGWGHSRGARIEYAIAKEMGLNIMFQG